MRSWPRTWPALRRLCRGQSVEFVEVDLRWGIAGEQSRRRETLGNEKLRAHPDLAGGRHRGDKERFNDRLYADRSPAC